MRALYEGSAVPVREIARLAGVTERTLYKYARKGGWTPRYAWADPGGVRQRRWRAQNGAAPASFAPVKGAGGRFVRREDKDQPFARGLKATDRQGALRAVAACARADAIGEEAQIEAAWTQLQKTLIDCVRNVNTIGERLVAYRKERLQKQPHWPVWKRDACEDQLTRLGHLALDCVECCQAHIARCGLIEMLQRAGNGG